VSYVEAGETPGGRLESGASCRWGDARGIAERHSVRLLSIGDACPFELCGAHETEPEMGLVRAAISCQGRPIVSGGDDSWGLGGIRCPRPGTETATLSRSSDIRDEARSVSDGSGA